jgi:L-ascorbate metabolism protein UlaG (beta-lactamase superfamily)
MTSERFHRRALLGGALAGAGTLAGAGALAGCDARDAGDAGDATAATQPWRGAPGTSGVTLRWLGNNAWEISFGATTILIDPWVTRFPTGAYGPTGARPDTPLVIDHAIVDRYLPRATLILVCHGHFDHLADVPYVAQRTGAAVLGTETHLNLLRALDTPPAQLTHVSGGEFLQYDGFTVEVFRSLHSLTGNAGARKQVPFPGTRPGPTPPRPSTIADLVEGGTLAYQITIGERFRILALSTANFSENELRGLRPDLAIVATGGGSVPDYAGRLMRTLGRPRWVLPTHWDDFDFPLSEPAHELGTSVATLRDAVAAASPHTTFQRLDHDATFTP